MCYPHARALSPLTSDGTTVATSSKIDVGELRVGMYVHLDLGWMSHPFPLSSFRIRSDEQIETIRSLGLKEVRWNPEKSLLAPAPSTKAADVAAGAAQAEAARREALAQQQAAQATAEQQYAEAAAAWRTVASSIADQPELAREQACALTRALVDKMLGEQELCIRTLTLAAGEQATAHALNVTILSLLMGRAMNLPESELMDLGVGAMLHDIGKLELPERSRFHDDAMRPEELSVYRQHVALGVQQGRRMGVSEGALQVIAQHHEQADGSGFPQQLGLESLSVPARVVGLINRYDGLCNPLVAARAMTPAEALALLFGQGKHKFDSAMLTGFIRLMGVYPPGSIVQLTDDRHGIVVSVNAVRPLKPRVLVHDAQVPRDQALILDLETVPGVGVRRSLKPSQLPPEALAYLGPARRLTYFFEPVPASPGSPCARATKEAPA